MVARLKRATTEVPREPRNLGEPGTERLADRGFLFVSTFPKCPWIPLAPRVSQASCETSGAIRHPGPKTRMPKIPEIPKLPETPRFPKLPDFRTSRAACGA